MKGGTVQINWHDTQPVLTLDFHPKSGLLATGGNDHDIKIWIIESDKSEKNLPTALYQNSLSYHSSAVNALRFSPSGEYLASGADGGELLLWKLQPTNEGQSAWKVHKSLLFHRKDVLDLEWSPNGSYLISGSVDNSCIIWDINKGSVHQILDAHLHYVQGVAWDPLGQYVASLSSDRTCRIYANKPQNKSKGNFEKLHFVCQHTLTKSEPPISDDSKGVKTHLFHDETLPSFFRRLSWSPDGSFLLIPAGVCKYPSATEIINTAYILSRRDLSRPAIQLPGASKAIVAIRFCPIIFNLINNSNSDASFKLPYRVIFAVATLNSLYIYDTQSIAPIAIFAGLHYAAITDISWSIDAKYLAVSSRDGYCTIIEFDNDELGQPYVISGNKMVEENAIISNMEVEKVDNMEIDDISGDKLERENNNEIKGDKLERENYNEIKGDKLERENSNEIKGEKVERENNNEIKGEKVERENNNEIKEDVQPKSVVRDNNNNNNNKLAKKRITPIAIN